MEVILFLLWLAVIGLVVGAIARLLLPGRETIGVLGTILAGIGGSFLGGLVGWLLFGEVNGLGALALAVAGALVLMLPLRSVRPTTY